MRGVYSPLAFGLVLLLFACGDDGPTDPQPPDPEPTTLALAGGGGQTGTVGASLSTPLSVRVTDQDGDPMSGVDVSWSTANGTIAPTGSTTGTDGLASATWTLGTTAGSQAATASVAGLTPVSISATAQPGAAASLMVTPDTLTFAALAQTAATDAVAQDEFGNAVEESVAFTSRDAAVASVDAGGTVESVGNGTTWVVVAAGAVSDSVYVQVLQEAATIELSPAADTLNAIGDTLALTAIVLDAGGSPLADALVTFESSAPSTVAVDADGNVVSHAPGSAEVTATFGALADTATILSRQVAASLDVAPAADLGLAPGETVGLVLSATDSNGVAIAQPATVVEIENAAVVTVTDDTVEAVAVGATTLTVSLDGIDVVRGVVVDSDGMLTTWQGGWPAQPNDWDTPYNWSPAGYAGANDTVAVPATANDPVLAAGDTVASLRVDAGAVLDLAGALLRLTHDVVSDGVIVGGTLEMVGTAATTCGSLPSLRLASAGAGDPAAAVDLTCDIDVNGTIHSLGGRLGSQGFTIRVSP